MSYTQEDIELVTNSIIEVYDNYLDKDAFPVDTEEVKTTITNYTYNGKKTDFKDVKTDILEIKIGDNNSYIIFGIDEMDELITVLRFSQIHIDKYVGIIEMSINRAPILDFNKNSRANIELMLDSLFEYKDGLKYEIISTICQRISKIVAIFDKTKSEPKFKIKITDGLENDRGISFEITYYRMKNKKTGRLITITESFEEHDISAEFLQLYSDFSKEEEDSFLSKPIHKFMDLKKYNSARKPIVMDWDNFPGDE
mgnify:FL=1